MLPSMFMYAYTVQLTAKHLYVLSKQLQLHKGTCTDACSTVKSSQGRQRPHKQWMFIEVPSHWHLTDLLGLARDRLGAAC